MNPGGPRRRSLSLRFPLDLILHLWYCCGEEVCGMAKTEYKQILLSRERLIEEIQQNNGPEPTAFAVVSAVACAAGGLALLFAGLTGRGPLLACVLLSLFLMACFWFALSNRRKKRETKLSDLEAVRNGQLYFVDNRVTGKESTDSSSPDSAAPSMEYSLYFHKTAKEGRRCIRVSREEYLRAAEGDRYHLLYLHDRLAYVFPCYKYQLDEEMRNCLVKDKAVVGEAKVSEYEQYRRLEREIGMLAKGRWLKTHSSIPRPDDGDGI